MKLIVKCENCRAQNKVPQKAHSRVVYAEKYGEDFKLRCKSCHEERTYEVDDIRAVDYSLIELIKNRILVYSVLYGIAIAIHVFILDFGILGFFLYLMPWIALALIKYNDSNKTLTFNRIKYQSRMTSIGQR